MSRKSGKRSIRTSYPQGATRAPRFCPSGRPAPLEGAGLKSLRPLPPYGITQKNSQTDHLRDKDKHYGGSVSAIGREADG